MTNNYENIYILKGSLTEEQAKKEIEEITKYFSRIYNNPDDLNGYQGIKQLAYAIKGETKGYYYTTYFKATPQKVKAIDEKLQKNDNVMKFITVKLEED